MERTNVALLGCPLRPDITWSVENLRKLRDSGFNAIQLNIAWGARAGDEPMSLEDMVVLPADQEHLKPADLPPLKSNAARWDERCAQLKQRAALAKAEGFKTIFHFGAPFNAYYGFGKQFDEDRELPVCIQDPKVVEYYKALVTAFAEEYADVDELLIYTYDQNAWLCSEFGNCRTCSGIPLHERVVSFVEMFAEQWQSLGRGKVWWEPWELSAGQVYKCIERIESTNVALALHSTIAEVMATVPVDQWFENTCRLAKAKGIQVIGEAFLGATHEEVEPLLNVWAPQLVFKQVRRILGVDSISGIKEYYGLLPDRYDMNLEMAALALNQPEQTCEQLMQELMRPFGGCGDQIRQVVTLFSDAMNLFPWQVSWMMRKLGRATENHSMDGAMLRGYCCSSPSWDSTRSERYMKTEDSQPHPWMLEDVELRLRMAVGKIEEALALGEAVVSDVLPGMQGPLTAALQDYRFVLKIAKSYIYHLRETNLAHVMRFSKEKNRDIPARTLDEMRETLELDNRNQGGNEEVQESLRLLDADVDLFLETFFRTDKADGLSRGHHTMTSR